MEQFNQRLRSLEDWRPAVERRFGEIGTKIDANTKITADTNASVKELAEFFGAAKVNARVVLWITAVLGGIGGAIAGFLEWFRR